MKVKYHSITSPLPRPQPPIKFFLPPASAVATKGQGDRVPPTTACARLFRFTQNTFSEHHVTTRQQATMEKGMNRNVQT